MSNEPKTPCPVQLGDIFKISCKEEAKRFLDAYHQWFVFENPDLNEEECMHICKSNIGYYAGYGSVDDMKKVFKLFDTAHPVFGTTIPTAKEALEMGKKAGRELLAITESKIRETKEQLNAEKKRKKATAADARKARGNSG